MYPFHERYCIRFYDEASGRLAGIWWRNNGRLLTPWGDLGRFPSPIQAVQALTMRRARFVGNLSEGKGG